MLCTILLGRSGMNIGRDGVLDSSRSCLVLLGYISKVVCERTCSLVSLPKCMLLDCFLACLAVLLSSTETF